MAALRNRLLALADGQTDLDAVVSSVEAEAKESLDNAETILGELDQAYKDDTLDLESFGILKKSVLSSITQMGSTGQTLDFDLTGASDDLDEATLVSETTTTRTALPGEAGTEPIIVGPGMLLRGRFYVDEVLGKGGMGTVYKGRDALKLEAQDRNPHIAIKVLNEDIKQRSDSFMALQREASRQQRLAHPNIATVYDFDRVGDVIFITMELLEGTPLDEYLKVEVRPRNGISFDEALPIIRGLASGLSYAHDSDIIHSDFKPSNCFLTAEKDVKILDFGIARAVRKPGQQEQTLFDGSKLGAMTPSYASYEMLESSGDPHPGDDVYALACVSYELLTGKHPFNRLPANVASENGLEAAPVAKLTRAQNRALAHGFAFHRENRTPSAEAFIEELVGSNAPAPKVWRIAAFAGVGVLLAVAVFFGVMQYQQGQLDTIVEGVVSPDPQAVETALQQIDELDAKDRQRILNVPAAKNRITEYFEQDIAAKGAALDFPAVQESLARARNLYGDSARIEIAAQRAVEQKNRMLGELSETYETLLRTKKFLPAADADDIPDVIDRLKKIDPQHSLITDARLASGYAAEADRMVSEYDFDAAKAVIDIGLLLAPGNSALVNVEDRLNKERVVAGQRARSQELEVKLAPRVAAATSLESFSPLTSDLAALAAIAPDSPIIARARTNIQPVVEERLAALQTDPKLAPLVALDTEVAPLLAAIGLTELGDNITTERDAAVVRVEQLANGIADAIALGNLDSQADTSATSQLAALRSIAPGDTRADDFQVQLITAFLSRAQDKKLAGAWGEARNQIALAGELQPSPTLETRLKTELANIDAAERQSKDRLATEDKQRAERQKQARVADLEQQLKIETEAAKTIKDGRQILQKLSSLEAIAPGNPLLDSTRQTLAEKLSAAAVDIGKSSGDWDKALKEVKNVDSLFPKSAAVATAQTQIEGEREQALLLAKQDEIEGLRTTLTDLASAKPNDAWSKNTSALLTKLAKLTPPADPWLVDMRNRLTDVYLAEAAKLQTSQRFTLAGQQFDRAAKINPGAASIKQGREGLKVALASFRSEQREKDTAARIAAHKQTFMAHVKSKQVRSAKKTLALLSTDLPADDPFVKTEAPALLANAYLEFATSRNAQKDYAAAIKFAESGLQYAPKNKQLLTALNTAKTELANAKKIAAVPKPAPPKPAPVVAPKPVPAIPTQITREQVFGDWCGDKVKLTLAANTFTFHLPGGGTASYPVKQYDFGKDTFTVQWSDKQRGAMETEFGKLASNNSSLTQMRGRSVSENKWNDYNRQFNRCR